MRRLVVVDLDKLDPDVVWAVRVEYDAVLTSEVLSHLTSLARDREARDAEKLAAMLGAPAIGAFTGGAA